MGRKSCPALIVIASPAKASPPSTIVRWHPLVDFICRLQIMSLAATQLAPPIQGYILRPHCQPGSQRSPYGVERVNLLPDCHEEIVDTFFCILCNAYAI